MNLFESVYKTSLKEITNEKTGKMSSFSRVPYEDGTKKWNVKLDDKAFESQLYNAGEGDFYSLDDGQTWDEVISSEYFEHHGEQVKTLRYMPVDEFGNKLTKKQLSAYINYDWQQANVEKGYLGTTEIDPESDIPALIVRTEGTYGPRDSYSDSKRSIKRMAPEEIDELDEFGRTIPTDEYLADHPDFDRDFDEVPLYRNKTKKLPFAGTRDERAAYKAAIEERDRILKNAKDKRDSYGRMYSPWTQFTSEFDKKQSNLSKEELEELKSLITKSFDWRNDNAPSQRDVKKWCKEHDADWAAVQAVYSDRSDDFAEAYANAAYN